MRSRHARLRAAVLPAVAVCLCVASSSCKLDAHRAALAAESSSDLGDVFEWSNPITLEENDEVINVTPRVSLDPQGGFLVADVQENQFRLYDSNGALTRFFGARGDGPGEFREAVAAVRMSDGSILAVDGSHPRAAWYDSDGSLLGTLPTQFVTVFDVDLLDDDLVLVSGGAANDLWNRLHIWDPKANTIVRSFFPAPLAETNPAAAAQAGFAVATVESDTIAALFALSDTVYLFDKDGDAIGQLPIPSQYFRPLKDAPPTGGRGGIRAVRDWLASFSMVSGVFWGPDGTFVIQWQDRENMMPKWRLLQMTRDGRRLFELIDTPEVLVGAENQGSYYFIEPSSETPNRWVIGQLRSHS